MFGDIYYFYYLILGILHVMHKPSMEEQKLKVIISLRAIIDDRGLSTTNVLGGKGWVGGSVFKGRSQYCGHQGSLECVTTCIVRRHYIGKGSSKEFVATIL